jgi:hypothetical protein
VSRLDDYVERCNAGVRSGDWEPLLDRLDERSAVYAWSRHPARPAGELHLVEQDDAIKRIRVLYEQSSGRARRSAL